MSLIGTLGEIPITEVLRLFASSRKTGLLTVAAPGREALVRLDKGTVVHAACGRLQGAPAVLDLFGWTQGQLSFVPDEKTVEPNVEATLDALIEEGERDGPRLHRMNEFFASERLVFQWVALLPEGAECLVGAPEWAVLRALDGARELPEVVEAAGLPRDEVQQVLFSLAETGFVERLELHRTLKVQAAGRAGTAVEVDARLEDEWRRSMRFADGVLNVEVRAGRGRRTTLGVAFRPALARTVVLPRPALAELGLREGDEASVRPVA